MATKSELKNLSGNDLSELAEMTARMLQTLEKDFLHVHEHFPAKVHKGINDFRDNVLGEIERRQNQ
jgi:hypothetical protein